MLEAKPSAPGHRRVSLPLRNVGACGLVFRAVGQREPRADWGSWPVRLLHPRRDVSLPVQNAPDVDVVGAFDVKDEVGVMRKVPMTQARQVEFVGVKG